MVHGSIIPSSWGSATLCATQILCGSFVFPASGIASAYVQLDPNPWYAEEEQADKAFVCKKCDVTVKPENFGAFKQFFTLLNANELCNSCFNLEVSRSRVHIPETKDGRIKGFIENL